jgi:hypothetical protein
VDETDAVLGLLQDGIDQGRPVVLEPRIYRLTQKITLTGGPLAVYGTPGLTRLLWESDEAGIAVYTSRHHAVPVLFSGVSFLVNRHVNSDALFVDYSGTTFPTSPERWGIFEGLTIKGSKDPFTSSWRGGISVLNGHRIGLRDIAVNGGVIGSEPNYRPGSFGVKLYRNRAAAGVYADHVEVMHCEDGFYCSDYEGVLINRSAFVGTTRGVHINHSSTYPHVTVSDTHCNSFRECIRVVGGQEILLSGNCLHLRSPESFGAAIRLTGGDPCMGSIIRGNTLSNYGDKSLMPIGIAAESTVGALIESNSIAEFGAGVWFGNGGRANILSSGSFRGCTHDVLSNTTTNKINAPAIVTGVK